jgi:PAS domain S-box-containing protein
MRIEGAPEICRKMKSLQEAPFHPEPAEEDLSRFFANALSLMCIARYDGFFARLNPAWTNTLGWTLQQLQDRPYIKFVHPEDRAVTLSEARNLLDGGRTIRFENRYLCKDGSYKWLQWTATSLPVRRQIYAIAHDVTEHRHLRKAIVEAGDREKERLGRELHDGLCQNLTAIAALNTALARKIKMGGVACAADVEEIGALLRLSIDCTRDLARGLNPMALPAKGIAATLAAFAANVQSLYGVDCRFQGQQCPHSFAPNAEVHLYRIAQQAVDNAIKHGRGRRIEINLSFQDKQGLLIIRDDGESISEKTAREKGGIGLHTMDYRAQLIGGALQVRRIARGGTAVTCRFPLLPDTSKNGRRARQ